MQVPGVPVSTRILTSRGWLSHDEVRAGDKTIGFNPKTGCSEWTAVTAVMRYDDAEVVRIGNGHWRADVTPDHRWWSERVSARTIGRGLTCPECGSKWETPRGMETHLGRAHRLRLEQVPTFNGQFASTADLIGADRLRLAAPADTDGMPRLSLDETAILGWIMGDGHAGRAVRSLTLLACPECDWIPGTGRKPYRGPVQEPWNSIAVHRAKAHGLRGSGQVREGEDAGWDVSIWQAKPAQVVRLRALLAHVPQTEHIRHRGDGRLPEHHFRLRRSYGTDLLNRARWDELSPEGFVLALSPDQRAAWLAAMIDAEGHTRDGFTRIAQNDGVVADAIRLAVYLEGYRPTFSRFRRTADHHKPGGQVGMARPHAAVSMFTRQPEQPRQPVWCVQTGLGTWTMWQGGGQPCLTGDSIFRSLPRLCKASGSGHGREDTCNAGQWLRGLRHRVHFRLSPRLRRKLLLSFRFSGALSS